MTALTEEQWEAARPLLQAALDQSEQGQTIEDVQRAISSGEAQLWIGERSAGVTEITIEINAWLFGGDAEESVAMLPSIEAFARTIGADRIVVAGGRPGWKRVLRSHGFETKEVLVKSL